MSERVDNYGKSGPQILVLYCPEDLGRIEPYTVFLQEDGRKLRFGVFYRGQKDVGPELNAAIRSVRHCILFLSDPAVRCTVLPEVIYQLTAEGKKILCVCLDEITFREGLSLMLDNCQAIYACRDTYIQDSVEAVRDATKRMLTDGAWGGLSEQVTRIDPNHGRRGRGRMKIAAAVCAVILLIAAALFLFWYAGG